MSYYISLYAEYRRKGERQWTLVGTDSITDDFKRYIVGESGDWTDSDRFNSFEPFNTVTLSDGLKEIYKGSLEMDGPGDRFRQLDIGVYGARIDAIVRYHRALIRATLVALGMNCHVDEYGELDVVDDWRIDDECSSKVRENRRATQLTFPVSKELICDNVTGDAEYSRALRNQGVLEAIRGMIPSYDEDSTEIRLVIVN